MDDIGIFKYFFCDIEIESVFLEVLEFFFNVPGERNNRTAERIICYHMYFIVSISEKCPCAGE